MLLPPPFQISSLLAAARPNFSPASVVPRVEAVLLSLGSVPAEASAHAAEVRGHVPTVWGSLNSAVRAVLLARAGGQQVAGPWASSVEWLALKQLYEEGKQRGELTPQATGRRRGQGRGADGTESGGAVAPPQVPPPPVAAPAVPPPPAPLPGAAELRVAVEAYADAASRLLAMERRAAIRSAEAAALNVDAMGTGSGVADLTEPGSAGEAAAAEAERLRAEAGRQGEREAGAALVHGAVAADGRKPLTHLKVRNVQQVDGMLMLTLSAAQASKALIGTTGLAVSDVVLVRPAAGAARPGAETGTAGAPARGRRETRPGPLGERRRAERREAAARELDGGLAEGSGFRGVVRRLSDYSIGVALEGESGLPGSGELDEACEAEEAAEAAAGRMSPAREARLLALARSIIGEAVRCPLECGALWNVVPFGMRCPLESVFCV